MDRPRRVEGARLAERGILRSRHDGCLTCMHRPTMSAKRDSDNDLTGGAPRRGSAIFPSAARSCSRGLAHGTRCRSPRARELHARWPPPPAGDAGRRSRRALPVVGLAAGEELQHHDAEAEDVALGRPRRFRRLVAHRGAAVVGQLKLMSSS